jgi:hypothetical protein
MVALVGGLGIPSSVSSIHSQSVPVTSTYEFDPVTSRVTLHLTLNESPAAPITSVFMAGNVMLFLEPGTEEAVLANMARHLAPDGLLVAGFQTGFPLTLQMYDDLAEANRLQLHERWATWNREPWSAGGKYAVSAHRLND